MEARIRTTPTCPGGWAAVMTAGGGEEPRILARRCCEEGGRSMFQLNRWYVAEAPRRAGGRLFNGHTAHSCLRWARERCTRPSPRVAVWLRDPPPDDGREPDAFVCVPARYVERWEARASEVVEVWERRWLLIESAPRLHRDDARADLLDAVAVALTGAFIAGASRVGPVDEEDVGF